MGESVASFTTLLKPVELDQKEASLVLTDFQINLLKCEF